MSQKTREFDPTVLNTAGHILWFDDLGTGNEKYRFLSNFYEGSPITLPGLTWEDAKRTSGLKIETDNLTGVIEFPTGEHAFAAMKFYGTDYKHFRAIVAADGPNPAKALGRSRQHPLREDWEEVKLDVMAAVLRAKFTMERVEGPRLLDTGDRLLVEGTFWYDEVWGVNLNENHLPGRNWLGTLLMARRAELRALEAFGPTGTEATDEQTQVRVAHFVKFTGLDNTVFSRG